MVKKEYLRILTQRLLAIIIFLLIWEIAIRTGLMYPSPIPPPSSIFYNLKVLASKEIFWECTLISLQRVCSGYALAIIIAIPLGFAVGWFRTLELYLDPLLQTLRQIPLLALLPVFIIFFGLGETPIILIIMLTAMWWILLNTISAVKNVDPFLVKTARSVGASQLDVLKKVVLPSAVPSIFLGLRYAYTEVMLVLIGVEMLGARAGLGVFVSSHQHHGQNHILMYSIIVFMTMLGVIANYILVAFERRVCRWKEGLEIC
ncbi:MAG: ABC transporter permease [Candidatus Methanoperedenaceae archaeon]|nr:MAG: ABC transporter permease [Candidatus Methanoperedenaceae archaeon]